MTTAEQRRRKAAMAASKKLAEAADAVNKFLHACRECSDGSGDEYHGVADGRIILIGNMMEYSGHLDSTFSKDQ
jgi:hypothetical protein